MKRIITTLLAVSAVSAMAVAEPTTLFYESFNNLQGQGGNDGYFDNDTDAGVEVGAEDLLDATSLDNTDGWGEFVKVAICDKCVRIATKKNPGSLTTPAITLGGADALLSFNAAAQLADVVTLNIEVVDGVGTLTYGDQTGSAIAIVLPESVAGETVLADQNYQVAISGVADACQLKFSTESSSDARQRAYLDEITVTADETGVNDIAVAAESAAPKGVYTLTGVKIAPERMTRGFYIIDGKKVIK
ncbi:MAG: hypothetical protein ACI30K_05220 [Muribaculaceae bacterium]